jgi:VWFA-related protein
MARANILISFALSFAFPAAYAADQGEVRIRYAPYHPKAATFAAETNLIELVATVRDGKGKPVGGLQKKAFRVFDNQKPQEIVFFQEQHTETAADLGKLASTGPAGAATPRPRYIALFFDDTHSGLISFTRAKAAAIKLITAGIQPGDRVGIFTGSGIVALNFTGDTKLLLATLTEMQRHPAQAVAHGFGVCPTLTAYQAYVITKHIDPVALDVAAADVKSCAPETPWEVALQQAQDAGQTAWEQLKLDSSDVLDILARVTRILAATPGEHVLLIVSPGFVTSDMDRQLNNLTEAFLRGHVVVNGLDDEGLPFANELPEALGGRGLRAAWVSRSMAQRMQTITSFIADAAAATGGRLILNNNDLEGGIKELSAAAPVSYVLGFSPHDAPDGKFHKLKVTTETYAVSARAGYVAVPPSERTETAQDRIDRIVASKEVLGEIAAAVKCTANVDKDGQYRIQIDIKLDAKHLPFSDANGKSLQQLTFVSVLQDSEGNFVEGKQAVMDMVITPATRAAMEAKGINATISFVAPKGSYVVREVIREAVHNRIAASTTDVPAR